MSKAPSILITEAEPADLNSLTTIVARSFHPTNAYIKATFPDTPGVREWWHKVFSYSSADPKSHVLVARQEPSPSPSPSPNPTTDTGPEDRQILAVLLLRLFGPHERGGGIYSLHPSTEGMDRANYEAITAAMAEAREKYMLSQGRANYMIELFGVDAACQGQGVGGKLLGRACEIARQAGHEMFVQANSMARPFYERAGFECRGEKVMPGEGKYGMAFLVRPGDAK